MFCKTGLTLVDSFFAKAYTSKFMRCIDKYKIIIAAFKYNTLEGHWKVRIVEIKPSLSYA